MKTNEINAREWAIIMVAMENYIYERKQNKLNVDEQITLYKKNKRMESHKRLTKVGDELPYSTK